MITTEILQGGIDSLDDAYMVREAVFIKEQGVHVDLERDEHDLKAVHIVVYDGKEPVACGRVIFPDNNTATLGRIAVLKEHRGSGYGDLVVRMLIRHAFDSGYEKQYVHSQLPARGFYEKLGFKAYGDEYMEAGIMHISMVHVGDVFGSCG